MVFKCAKCIDIKIYCMHILSWTYIARLCTWYITSYCISCKLPNDVSSYYQTHPMISKSQTINDTITFKTNRREQMLEVRKNRLQKSPTQRDLRASETANPNVPNETVYVFVLMVKLLYRVGKVLNIFKLVHCICFPNPSKNTSSKR